ncbi:unnamed protein product [Closterium sp. NIES-53]
MARFIQILVMSLFHGFNFFQMPSDPPTVGNLNLRRGITFLSLVAMTLFNLSQLPIFMEERLVYYKHSSAQSFRTYTYLLAHVLAGAPFSIIEATVWSIIVYFLAGFSLSDGGVHFWIFYAIMILTVLHGSAMVCFIAFSTRNPAAAAFFSALLVGPSVFLFIHLLIPQSLIRGYWIWVYRIDALQWAATMMQVNEFRSSKFNTPCTEVLPPTYLMPSSSVSNSSAAFPLLPLSPYICLLPGYYQQHFPHPKILPPSCLAAKSESKESVCANGIRPAAGIDVLPSEPRNGHDVAVEFGEIEARNGESEGWQAECPPFQPVVLAWQILSYKITSVHFDRDMEVMKSISGWVKPGEITGIVGGRGAGKTSLLNCLAGRKIRGRITGQLSVNGLTHDLESFIQCTAYIEGGHQHYPYLTVRESLMYRTDLLLPQAVSRKSRNSFVDKILKVTRVNDLAEYLVNDLLTSGGSGLVFTEKRIVLAMELAGNPSALFLDTPFIGMDMQQIVQFAEILDSVATGWGKAMVVSTNVPTVVQLNIFTSVLMLRNGGEMVYFGPVGRFGSAIVEYFQAIPDTPMLPDNMNPISFLQYAMGEGVSDSVAARDYAFEYRISNLAMSNAQHLRKLRRSPNSFYASEASYSTAAMPALPGSGQALRAREARQRRTGRRQSQQQQAEEWPTKRKAMRESMANQQQEKVAEEGRWKGKEVEQEAGEDTDRKREEDEKGENSAASASAADAVDAAAVADADAAAREEEKREEEERQAKGKSAEKEAQWKKIEEEIRRELEEEFRVKMEELERQFQQRSQQKQHESEALVSTVATCTRCLGASASVLASFNARLRDWEARVKAALAVAQKRILRTEGEVTKKRKAEECQRKAEEVKRSKAEGASRKQEEAKQAAEMKRAKEEDRKRVQAEKKRVKEEERKRKEEAKSKEDLRKKEEETRQKEEKKRKEELKRKEKEEERLAQEEAKREEEKRRAQEKERERARKEEAAFDETMNQLEEYRRRQAGAPITYEKYSSRITQLRKQAASAGVASNRTPGTNPLRFWDIPWPPTGNCLFLSPGDSLELQKRKAMDALLFWHADRFVECCGRWLVAGHREAVLRKAAGVSREVVEAKQRLWGAGRSNAGGGG